MTSIQIAAIIMLLQAFGVGQFTINEVRADLAPRASYVAPVVPTPIQAPSTPVVPVFGAVATSTPACDDTPTFNITPVELTTALNLNSLNLIAGGEGIAFDISISSACGGQWKIWMTDQNSSNIWNPQQIAPGIIDYNPIQVGTYILTFYASDGTTTANVSYPVTISAN